MRWSWWLVAGAWLAMACGGNAQGGAEAAPDAGAGVGGIGTGGSGDAAAGFGGSAGVPVKVSAEALDALAALEIAKCEADRSCCGDPAMNCEAPPEGYAVEAYQKAALGLSVDVDCARQIAQEYELASDCRAFDPLFVACCDLFYGEKPAGASCEVYQCERGLQCEGPSGVCGQTLCPQSVGLGEPCQDGRCEAGLLCDTERTGRCVEAPGEGESCVDSKCSSGNTCVSGTCLRAKERDEPCSVDEECLSFRCEAGLCHHWHAWVCHYAF